MGSTNEQTVQNSKRKAEFTNSSTEAKTGNSETCFWWRNNKGSWYLWDGQESTKMKLRDSTTWQGGSSQEHLFLCAVSSLLNCLLTQFNSWDKLCHLPLWDSFLRVRKLDDLKLLQRLWFYGNWKEFFLQLVRGSLKCTKVQALRT